MNAWKNALVVAALLVASTAAAQRATRTLDRSLGSARAIGMVGDGSTRSIVVFDANTDTVLGSVPLGTGATICYGDCVITSDLSLAYVVTVGAVIWVVDLTTSPPSLASGTNPISIPNFGLDIVLTPDERFLIVCGGNNPHPVAVVDVATRTVVDTFSTGNDCIAVDAGPDGTVLVASDTLNRIKRLEIDATGNLTDTGESLVETNPLNLYELPGETVGLVVVWNTGQVRSFTIPGLALIDTLSTVGADFGVCALADPSRNRIYVRKDLTLQAFPFDSATGDFGTIPDWNVTPGAVVVCYGVEQLALHPDGSKLYTTAPGGLQIRDPASGVLLGTLTHPDIVAPSGLCIAGSVEVEEVLATMDIKPGSCPNSFNRDGHGVLPVALVGRDDFDVTQVDIATLRLRRADGMGGSVLSNEELPGPITQVADVSEKSEGEPCVCRKLEGDGTSDLEAHFKGDDLVFALELDTLPTGTLVELALTGELLDGTHFSASDCVRLVAPGTPPGALTITTARDGWVQVSPLDLQLDGGGFDRFERTYPLGTPVTLTAFEIEGLPFFAWVVDGVTQKPGQRTLQLHVRSDHSELRAVYGNERARR